ncbi:TetR/AcrR family transcriptional regulator [Wukongibacter sp. M2B1]|uniref:TetR/AcrR family transcriptional regulator n=1 Tax=Wukongibacter sp. M2B1 TaxID=3088895 RepID=UPI003D7C1335
MNGHIKRAINKQNHIKKSALELFNKYGPSKVSIDEIANHANVSKVTIYKYFDNKNGLYREIIKMIFDEHIKAVQRVISDNLSFFQKLKIIIATKSNSLYYLKGEFLQELIKSDHEIEEHIEKNYKNKIKELMFVFYDQGKREGYIDKNLSNEIIYLYIDIFRIGLKEKSLGSELLVSNSHTFEELIDLFFYGLIKRSERT